MPCLFHENAAVMLPAYPLATLFFFSPSFSWDSPRYIALLRLKSRPKSSKQLHRQKHKPAPAQGAQTAGWETTGDSGKGATSCRKNQCLDKHSCLDLGSSTRILLQILMERQLDNMDFSFPLGKGAFKEAKQNKRGLGTAAWVCFLPVFEIKYYWFFGVFEYLFWCLNTFFGVFVWRLFLMPLSTFFGLSDFFFFFFWQIVWIKLNQQRERRCFSKTGFLECIMPVYVLVTENDKNE